MSLAADLQRLAATALADLDASHDYFTFTKRVWRFAQKSSIKRRTISFRNLMTGSAIDKHNIAARSQAFIDDYLLSATFQHLALNKA